MAPSPAAQGVGVLCESPGPSSALCSGSGRRPRGASGQESVVTVDCTGQQGGEPGQGGRQEVGVGRSLLRDLSCFVFLLGVV